MWTIREHYLWLFGVPMDMAVVEDKAEEDGEDKVEDGSADEDDELSSLSSMTKRTALKTRMVARRMRPLTVSEMDQCMHHHLDGANVHSPATPDTRYLLEEMLYGLTTTVLLGRLLGRLAILHESGMRILLTRIAAARGTWTDGGRWRTWELLDPSCLGAFESTPGPWTLRTPDYRLFSTTCRQRPTKRLAHLQDQLSREIKKSLHKLISNTPTV